MKKKKNLKNSSGITVCDSIVMSVKKKHMNLRRAEAVIIAVIGYISAIMTFLLMFDFNYSKPALAISAVLFSILYIFLSLMGKNAVWFILTTIIAASAVSYKLIDYISTGYKFVYNTIYQKSYHTDISYYKFLNENLELKSVTIFFIFGALALALIIYVFTIYHPNSLPPLIMTFPLLEIGLYNGIEVSVFWGTLLVAFWLALFAMTTIDMGEYSGGSGGFVRKDNMFFPKRQMRLKVTEKCGVYIIVSIIAIASLSAAVMTITDYKRSDSMNQRRIEIRDAVKSFSMDDLVDSLSDITEAFGVNLKREKHKLGNIDQMKYKDIVDMTVTLDSAVDGAIYLKDYTGCVYGDNEWAPLSDSAYDNEIFKDFKKYEIYPQDFPNTYNHIISTGTPEYTIWIESKLRGSRTFAPYGVDNVGEMKYDRDKTVSSESSKKEFSYKFSKLDTGRIAENLSISSSNAYITNDNGDIVSGYIYNVPENIDEEWRSTILEYAESKNKVENGRILIETKITPISTSSYNNPEFIMSELLRSEYEKFVERYYLQLPSDTKMTQVREEYEDLIAAGEAAETASEKLAVLDALRTQVSANVEYSLRPGKTPKNRDFVNYFLLENQKGYCTHYATAGVILARMSGIPARYATGYVVVGDDFNDSTRNADGTYTIDLKDDRSHAWIEVYLSGYGWIPFEFTAGYSEQTIDTSQTTTAVTTDSINTETTTANQNTAPHHNNTTTRNSSATSSSPQTTTSNGSHGNIGGNGSGAGHLRIYYIFTGILSVAAIVLLIIGRRKFIIHMRIKHFSTGANSRRIVYIYEYTDKLLKFINCKRGDKQYMEFAEFVEKNISGIYFEANSYQKLVEVALRNAFSAEPPNDDEIEEFIKFTKEFAENVYNHANIFGKFYLKYISCKY